MRYLRTLKLLLGILLILCVGCEDFTQNEKYKRPDWLPGKLFTTVSVQENLTMFTECLRLTGLDTILDVSGCFTVFAPTDEAMEQYLSENQYASVSDIPSDELEKITEFHIIQNPWTLEQLKSLSAYGWRTGDNSNRSYAYKRQTIFKNPNEKYWIRRGKTKDMIVSDSTISDGYKKVFVKSRKYVPIFFDEYMDDNGITSEDFSFYFDRAYDHGNVYYAGAKIIQADIFAENGFVHIIDRVVSPMLNGKELLEREMPGETYHLFLDLVYWYYPAFEANEAATIKQPEVGFGGVVDTLWDLSFPGLDFAIHNESTGTEGPNVNQTLVRHNGMFAPTDDAFRDFIDVLLTVKSGFPHWPGYRALPMDIVKIIVPPHLESAPIYPSTNYFQEIFSGEGRFQLNEGDIVRKEFGSNCTFIGVNSYTPNRVFTSVTGPVFLRPAYSLFRLAMQYSNTDDEIANIDGELSLFAIPDYALNSDSSLMVNWSDGDNYYFTEYNRTIRHIESLWPGAIRDRMLNQVGTSLPDGSAKKEFIQTLGGNYIIWNNSDNTVRGNLPCTIGYNGDVVMTCYAAPLEEPADNGKTYSVKYWFNFENKSMRTVLSGFSKFSYLLGMAGLSDLSFLNRYENYTVFVPSDEALASYQTDTMSMETLRGFLKNHFLRGAMIFTDNKLPSGYYETAGEATLNIRTGPDVIEILDDTGNPYVVIPEKDSITNITVSERSTVSSVVHEIDKMLIH